MGEVVLSGNAHELARRQVMHATVSDLRDAADEIESLAQRTGRRRAARGGCASDRVEQD